MLTHGSLFTGIGGMDLGLERAGFETIWQVEKDDYARRVLDKHWPDVRRHDDIATFPPDDSWECPDIISGGFPCQDLSVAGKQAGIHAGRSGLWWEMLRVIRHFRPQLVLVENVPALLSGGGGTWASAFFGSLAESGFDCEWDCIPAAAVGAPHLRYRAFVVGYSAKLYEHGRNYQQGEGTSFHPESGNASRTHDVADAERNGWAGRDGDMGNELLQQERNAAAEIKEDRKRLRPEAGGSGEDVADTKGQPQRPGLCPEEPRTERRERSGHGGGAADVPDANRTGLAVRKSECGNDGAQFTPPVGSGWWAVEPDVGRVAHGVPKRVDRLRCLGNAVVPAVAQFIGKRIMQCLSVHTPGRDS